MKNISKNIDSRIKDSFLLVKKDINEIRKVLEIKNSKVEIDETIERLETDPLKPHDYKGDLWAKVVSVNGTPVTSPTYIAITYHNSSSFTPLTLCDKYYNVVTNEEPPDGEITSFPDFILVKINSDGTLTEKKYTPE